MAQTIPSTHYTRSEQYAAKQVELLQQIAESGGSGGGGSGGNVVVIEKDDPEIFEQTAQELLDMAAKGAVIIRRKAEIAGGSFAYAYYILSGAEYNPGADWPYGFSDGQDWYTAKNPGDHPARSTT